MKRPCCESDMHCNTSRLPGWYRGRDPALQTTVSGITPPSPYRKEDFYEGETAGKTTHKRSLLEPACASDRVQDDFSDLRSLVKAVQDDNSSFILY